MKISQLIVLLGLILVTQSFIRNLQTNIPCINDITRLSTFTSDVSAASSVNVSFWNDATINLNGQQYKYYYGNWSAGISNTITLATYGYNTQGNNVYMILVRSTKNVSYTVNITNSKLVGYEYYQQNTGYIYSVSFNNQAAGLSNISVTLTSNVDCTVNTNQVSISLIWVKPPNQFFQCQQNCTANLYQISFNGQTYPGVWCGSAPSSPTIPTFNSNAPPSNDGQGYLAQHQLNPCPANPLNLTAPQASNWTITQVTSTRTTSWAKTSGGYYNGIWTNSAQYTGDADFQIYVDFDATGQNDTKNNISYILGFVIPVGHNISFQLIQPNISTPAYKWNATYGQSQKQFTQNVMITQTFDQKTAADNNNTYITFRANILYKADQDSSKKFKVRATPRYGTGAMNFSAYLGVYKPPTLQFTCTDVCQYPLSPFVLFGYRFVGAICWGAHYIVGASILIVLSLIF